MRAVITSDCDLRLCNKGMSLLYGVAESEILPGIGIPDEWKRRAVQRVKEATAHTGHESLLAFFQYWCDQEFPDAEAVLIQQDEREP
ncbi:hypothetical protein A5715_00610 [Mycolicibacter heraklionensis]|nr:hypothetical protein A5715_00610 [Mycolicibacter heraklionensis]